MAGINSFGKNLEQVLSAYGATNIAKERRTDVTGQAYDRLSATLPDGGHLTGKVIPEGGNQLTSLEVYNSHDQHTESVTLDPGRDGKATVVDTFTYATTDSKEFFATMVKVWDAHGADATDRMPDGKPDGKYVSRRAGNEWFGHSEYDKNQDGVFETVEPEQKVKIFLNNEPKAGKS